MDIYDIVQTLPANLEANALARFDDLETQGRLYYGAPQHRVVKHDSFTVCLLNVNHIRNTSF